MPPSWARGGPWESANLRGGPWPLVEAILMSLGADFFRRESYRYTMKLWAALSRSLLKFVYDIGLFLDTVHGEKKKGKHQCFTGYGFFRSSINTPGR